MPAQGTASNDYDPSEDNDPNPFTGYPQGQNPGYGPAQNPSAPGGAASPTNPNGALARQWGNSDWSDPSTNGSYGGINGGQGAQDMYAYNAAANAFQSRAPISADLGASNAAYGQAAQNFGAAQASRQGQVSALGLLAGQAAGTAVDPAVQQMNAQAAAAGQAQRSIAAGAGGGFGGAAAVQGASRRAADLQQQNVAQAGIQHASDMAQARAAYSSASNDLRSSDLAQRSASLGQAYQQGQLANMQSQLGLANQQANDAQTRAFSTLGAQYAQLGENDALTQYAAQTGMAQTQAQLNGQAFGQASSALGAGLGTLASQYGQGQATNDAPITPQEDESPGYGPSYGV